MIQTELSRTILNCERARCAALLATDVTALAELLSERLLFVHANATLDGKATLLAKLREGHVIYRQLVVDEEKVIAATQGTAILSARLTADLTVRGAQKRVRNLALYVWTLEEDNHWRLLAYQPTAL